ncbi:MAG TPA: hypothetical protein VFP42_05675 [Acidimicrobiia bacterium]|nr:hypothetical protein [Acidimicrobiia bacterium]
MQAKSVLYAAVGAPVVAAKKVTAQVTELKGKVSKETANYTEVANKALDEWAAEGEKVVTRISEGKVVEEISSKVDLDQAKEQVGKLRDQLEDMLATWRTSFRPEKGGEDKAGPAPKTAAKPAAKKPAASKAATTKTSTARTTTASSGKSSTAGKTSAAKSTPVKGKAS